MTRLAQGDVYGYEKYGKMAFYDFPSLSLARSIAVNLAREGELDKAIAWLDEFINYAENDLQKNAWKDQMKSMRDALRSVQGYFEETT